MTNVAQSLFSISTTTHPIYSDILTTYGYNFTTNEWISPISNHATSTTPPTIINKIFKKKLFLLITLLVGTTLMMTVCFVVALKLRKHMRMREIERVLAPVYTYDISELEINGSFSNHDNENNRNNFLEENGNQLFIPLPDMEEVKLVDKVSRKKTVKNTTLYQV
ncbi:uncharacterized protein LOC105848101 isoform X2 [Hydra vulgaris]|uniref:Uncharacterized protein LOC105848101 isoform X2 n=1 Tax=Hydra vulgaris TaxID=6087 RepID=A0ABM4DGL9_HYDVU